MGCPVARRSASRKCFPRSSLQSCSDIPPSPSQACERGGGIYALAVAVGTLHSLAHPRPASSPTACAAIRCSVADSVEPMTLARPSTRLDRNITQGRCSTAAAGNQASSLIAPASPCPLRAYSLQQCHAAACHLSAITMASRQREEIMSVISSPSTVECLRYGRRNTHCANRAYDL